MKVLEKQLCGLKQFIKLEDNMLIKIPRRRVSISFYEILTFIKFLFLGKLKQGKEIERFEKEFAKYIGVKYAVPTYSGKQALYLILKSLNLKRGDEILIPSYTASSVPVTILYAGFKPKFVDVDFKTFNINPNLVEKMITKRTKAIIATHIHGLPCDMDALSKICKKYDILLIEDCAHALGAEYKGRKIGSFGKASFFSFGLGKHLSTFGGGIIVSNDFKLIQKVREYIRKCEFPSNFELFLKLLKTMFVSIFTNPVVFSFFIYPIIRISRHDFISELFETKISPYKKIPKEYKKRFSNFQAFVGLHRMNLIENNLSRRIENALILKKGLKKLKEIKFQEYSNSFKHVYLDLAVFYEKREKLIKELLTKGIDTQRSWLNDCSSLPFFKKYGYSTPISNKLSKKVFYLPIDSWLDKKRIREIVKVFKSLDLNN